MFDPTDFTRLFPWRKNRLRYPGNKFSELTPLQKVEWVAIRVGIVVGLVALIVWMAIKQNII